MAKIVFIGSTGGGVLSRLLRHEFVKEITLEVVADRRCGFLEVASAHSVAATLLLSKNGDEFSEALQRRYAYKKSVIFISFYTRRISSAFLVGREGFVYNCHPSLLPSFKGMKGFEDTIASTSKFMGCTLHVVTDEIDGGQSVIQGALPLNRKLDLTENRHRLFLMQYYSVAQFIRWVADARLTIHSGEVNVREAIYRPQVFSPNLDDDFFELLGEANELS